MKKHFKAIGFILMYLTIYMIMQIMVSIPLAIYAVLTSNGNMNEVTNIVGKYIVISLLPAAIISFIVYWIIIKLRKQSIQKICRFNKVDILSIVLAIFVTFSASSVVEGVMVYIEKFFPSYDETAKILGSSMNTVLGIIIITLLIPMFEEILFRGLVMSEIEKNIRISLTVVIQGVLFGVYHLNLLQGLYAGILGILLGYLCISTNSIFTSMAGHITFNICGGIVLPLLLAETSQFAYVYIIVGAILTIITVFIFQRHNKKLRMVMEQ
ncbi:MAG: type II CAAX endopeptidase family protein [Bacillota bacterium]|nr:type II CAAX endopeptidase family protein [Bacillota bacterium]